MGKLLIPNTCQVPNVLLDKVMPNVNVVALKVLLAITRFTYGFGKPSDKISLTQLEKATGLSRQGVISGIKTLGDLITVKRDCGNRRIQNEYSLNLDINTGELVNNFDQSKKLTSQKTHRGVVNKVDPSKPIISKPKRERVKGKPSPSNGSDPRVKEFFAWWDGEYQKRFSDPYHFNGGREGSLIKRLLKSYESPRLHSLAICFLNSKDPWIQQHGGYTLGVFAGQINKLVSTAKAKENQPQPREYPA